MFFLVAILGQPIKTSISNMDLKEINIKKIKKVFSWIAFGFLIVVLVFVLFPLLPVKGNYSLKMVTSGSMSPTIKTGSVIMVKPVLNYRVGDIITYQEGRRARDLVSHRIVGQQGDEFITKGDNNNAADIHPIKKEQIVGKVFLTIPYVGYIANFAHSRIGFILFIIIPALFIIGNESLKIFKEVRKRKISDNEKSLS